jgi:hypothetical protein
MLHLTARRSNTLFALLGIAGASLASGCIAGDPADEGDGHVGVAQQRQLDSGTSIWRKISLAFNDTSHTPLATIYVFNVALGSYTTDKEYWFVNRDSTSMVGRYSLSIVSADQSTSTAPPDPGYTNEQSFSLTEDVSWGSGWSTDPLGSGGSLYDGPNHISLRLYTSTGSSPTISGIAWYQAIASGGTPANITPSGSFSIGGSSFSVPSGDLGYDIDQRP